MAHGFVDELRRFAAEVDHAFEKIAADSSLRDRSGRLRLRGHAVAEYLHFGLRRLCPACLLEKWHHRFWWDLEPVSTCPRHGLTLLDACRCGTKFGWRGGGLVHCSHCLNDQAEYLPQVPADPKVRRSDAYILARFDAGPAERVPILDPLDMPQVFMMMERIGSACEGYSREWRSAKTLGLPLGMVQARGFEVLAEGKLDEVLTRIYDGYIAQGGKSEAGFTECYGWLYHWFNHKRGARFSPLLAEAFHRHGAQRFPIVPKAQLGQIPDSARRKLSLKEAARRAETSVFAMKNIGLVLGLIRIEKRSGSQLSFPTEEVERIARDLKGALSLEETMKRLGVARRPVLEMMENGSLVPALVGGGQRHAFVFRHTDIDALLRRLADDAPVVLRPSDGLLALSHLGRSRAATIGRSVRVVLDGKLRVRERLKGAVGLQGLFIDEGDLEAAITPAAGEMVPFAAAARRMRLNSRGLSRAIALGMFPSVEKGAKALPAKHVEAFANKFIMMGEVRERVGGYFPTLKDQLERAGFRPDKKLAQCLNSGYLRAEVEPFLEKLRQGEASLKMPAPARNVVIEETRRILDGVERPVETKEMLSILRKKKVQLGPSDKDQFFYATMNEERHEFVYLTGAGWWLRRRQFMGRTFPADRETPSYHDMVDDEIVAMVGKANRPLMPDEIVADLARKGTPIAAADPVAYLRRMAIKRPQIVRFHGKGYWDAAKPWASEGFIPSKRSTVV